MTNLESLSRADRLLILAAIQVDSEENTFSGHNSAWVETVDLVLEGRRGYFDYSDQELLEELEELFLDDEASPVALDEQASVRTPADLVAWARKFSKIGSVDSLAKTWTSVPESEQAAWRKEEK